MGKLWRRIYFFLNRSRIGRELADEMDAHREMMPPDRRHHFGNDARLQEESREMWSWPWFDQLRQDLAYGVRMLWRARSFTIGATAVLALGVGVNLAEFQILDSMILHRLRIRDADACLQFSHRSREGVRLGFPFPAFEFYRAKSRSFAWLVAEDISLEVTVEDETGLRSTLVSADYFSDLGVVPAWGRLLDARDAEPGAPPVVVLSYDYWRRRWNGDPDLIGRTIRINHRPVQVVGVTPLRFEGLIARGAMVWMPIPLRAALLPGSAAPQQDFSRFSFALYGKLKPDISRAAGEAELTSLTRELARQHPAAFRDDEIVHANLVHQSILQTIQRFPAIAILMVIILLVLLSACANLGNLLLARGLARQREIRIRLSVGASRARVVRQLMTESLLLAILGAAAGAGFAAISARLLLYALNVPMSFLLSTRWPIFAVGLVLTLLSAAVFGLPAALRTVRVDHRKIRLGRSLIGVQVAVSCLLLIAAGTLAHSGMESAAIDIAFDYRNMVVVYPQLYGRNLPPAILQQKVDGFLAELGALPGVDGIAAAEIPPMSGRIRMDRLPGLPRVYMNSVGPSYFEVMNLPILRGRTFATGDDLVVVVSESAARAVWPGQDPLGKTWQIGRAERTVVGVVKDSGANLLPEPDSIEAYTPIAGAAMSRAAWILHTRGDSGRVARLVPGAAERLNELVTVTLMNSLRENLLETQRKLIKLIGSIGLVATVLAAAGMFALVAFAVAQRRREFGIRIAIGARPRQILSILITQHARPITIGVAIGIALAAILSRLVRGLIPMRVMGSLDLIGVALGIASFLVVAVLATLSPAVHALRIDPSTTLREE